MLSWNTILKYVRGRLALPSTFIEYNDEQIKEWCIITALKDYSNYIPDTEWVTVLANNSMYIVPGKHSHYYFFDEEELGIYGIKQCYFSIGNDYVTGHPPFGAFSFEGMKWWSLEVFKSRFFKPFSNWAYTYIFIPPNTVRVLPELAGQLGGNENFVVEYEREQPHDLRKIPAATERIFMDLCFAEVSIWIGSLRAHYSNIQTPFGEIPLRGDEMIQRGEDMKREAMDKLIENQIPTVIVDVG